jgi:tetratricopeptide (TPR) repeat protein
LSEESFERIVDHFDDQDAIPKAMEAVELGIQQFPYSSSLLVKKADLLIATRQYSRALSLLDKAEILDKNDIDIYILRTDAYLALDQQSKAVTLLEEAIQQFDGDERIDLLFELADVYDDYEAFEKIFDCLKLILEYDPNNEEALYKICFWTDFTGRNEESIRLHLNIIEEFPYNDLAWFNLAAAYQGLKLFEKAIDAYQYAIAINEKFDFAYRNLADAQMRLRRYKEAIECLVSMEFLHPSTSMAPTTSSAGSPTPSARASGKTGPVKIGDSSTSTRPTSSTSSPATTCRATGRLVPATVT